MASTIARTFIDRDFFSLLSSRFISQLGDKLFMPAVLWMALAFEGGSATRVGIVSLAMAIPPFMSAFIGVLVDRVRKKNLMILCDMLRFVLCVLLFADLYYLKNFWFLVVVIFIIEFLGQFYNLSSQTFIPTLVPKEHLMKANSLFQLSENITSIVGYSAGGVLIAFFGANALVVSNGVSFLLSGLLLLRLPSAPHVPKTNTAGDAPVESVFQKFVREFKVGLRESYANKIIGLLLIVALIVNAASASLGMMITIWSHDVLHLGSTGYGLLLTSLLVGALIGSLMTNIAFIKNMDAPKQMSLSILLCGASLIALAYLPNQWTSMLMLALAGVCMSLNGISFSTLFMKSAGKENLGKLFGLVQTVTRGGQPLGVLLVTSLITYAAPYLVLFVIGAIIVLAGLFLVYRFFFSSASPTKTVKQSQ